MEEGVECRSQDADAATDAAERMLRSLPLESTDSEYRARLLSLRELFLAGADPDWTPLANPRHQRVVPVPTYRFQRRRYWVETPAPRSAQPSAERASETHYFRLEWRRAAAADKASGSPLGTVLIFAKRGALCAAIQERLREVAPSARSFQVRPGRGFERVTNSVFEVEPGSATAVDALLSAVRDEAGAVTHVAHAWAEDELPGDVAALNSQKDESVYTILALRDALARSRAPHPVSLLFFYRGSEIPNPVYGGLDGVFKTVLSESPRVHCRSIGVPSWNDRDLAELVVDELSTSNQNAIVRFDREGQRYARAIVPLSVSSARGSEPSLRREGHYLISGGLGSLGLLVARHFAARCRARLSLLGRTEPNPAQREVVDELERLGARVRCLTADVADERALREAVATATSSHGPLNGVLHAAGNLRSLQAGTGRDAIEEVLRPKLEGLLLLDRVTQKEPLDWFLLFSSISAVVGNPGQADYAYANSFMDHYAEHREGLRRSGLRSGKTLSIGWPLWQQGGLRVGRELERLVEKTQGVRVLSTSEGLEALETALAFQAAHVIVVSGDASEFSKLAQRGVDLAQGSSAPAGLENHQEPGAMSLDALERWIVDEVVSVLKVDRASVNLDDDLMDYGFDSIILTELANRLNERHQLDVTPASFFEHSTIRDFAGFIWHQHGSKLEPRPPVSPTQAVVQRAGVEAVTADLAPEPTAGPSGTGLERAEGTGCDVAIVGMWGEYPDSENLEEFWRHLESGHELIRECPAERWNVAVGAGVRGGFLRSVDGFDASFFGIPPREAELMDPQQRLFLEAVWCAIEDAGYRPSSLWGSKTGVFVGVATSDYGALLEANGLAKEALAPTGTSHAVLANRVSYYLNLNGPSEPCNTACSSSLFAIHRACEAIRSGSCAAAIAGGVNLLLSPTLFRAFGAAGMLTPDGTLRAFDEAANGYVRGEGVGALLLKPLQQAIRDGDHVYGVIKASVTNHGGRASSLTAPNPNAQAELLIEAYRRAGVSPDRVSLLEAHGSGTSLGDPIEINGIKKAFEVLYREWDIPYSGARRCLIGSVKGNVGHLEAAAGMAGVSKVLLALEQRRIPPNATLTQQNPQIRLERTPFALATRLEEWDAPAGKDGSTLRVAGVSSFGFGGANAHVVIEEYREQQNAETGDVGPHVVVLSARSEAALRNYASRLLRQLRSERGTRVSLADLAYTSQLGREPMAERLAVVAQDRAELLKGLESFVAGNPTQGVFRGRSERSGQGILRPDKSARPDAQSSELMRQKDWERLCQAWVAGAELDWTLLHDKPRRRISFTPYPFERKTYWYDAALPSAATDSPNVSPAAERETFPEVSEPTAPAKLKLKTWSDREQVYAASAVSASVPRPAVFDLLKTVRSLLAATLHVSEDELATNRSFAELGLDSILALEFVKRINAELGIDFKVVELFDHGTIARLAEVLASRIPNTSGTGVEPAAAAAMNGAAVEPARPPAARLEDLATSPITTRDIAVIGLALRAPGAADAAAFWKNLRDGVAPIRQLPEGRWQPRSSPASPSHYGWGGFLDDVDKFDPLFFNISPHEARLMDPQQRLFLETAWTAFEDAGYSAERLGGLRCGVFAGAMNNDYYELISKDPDVAGQAQTMTGNAGSILAARVAYILNLKGPVAQLDTACSSSLVATHLACRALLDGEADMMLAGGVTLYLAESSYAKMLDARMLSPSGRCKTFDRDADGFVPGEAVGAVVLKRLDDAVADGDRIYGVIKGTATNQDGRTNGITAPSAQSQTALEVDLYRRYGIHPETITYVEAHGTGTKLGDPIEVKALTDAFRTFTSKTQFCGIGSVKTNVGHTAAAAGVVSLIKVLLALQHREVPPSLNFTHANTLLELESSPFRVVTELSDWVAAAPRRAAVSSFGFSGTNAHLVVEEYQPPPAAPEVESRQHVVLLSATDEERLRVYVRALAEHLARAPGTISLADLAYTLQVGRTPLAARLSLVVSSVSELQAALENFQRGAVDTSTIHVSLGAGSPSSELAWLLDGSDGSRVLDLLIQAGDVAKLAKLWTLGAPIDWTLLGSGARGRARIVSLPTYPFARERCWVQPASAEHQPPASLHVDPVLSLERGGLVLRTRLSERDVLLRDHLVEGQPVLPGALCVDLALSAARLTKQTCCCLGDVAFIEPLRVCGETELELLVSKSDAVHTFEIRVGAVVYARGEIRNDEGLAREPRLLLPEIEARCRKSVRGEEIYRRAAALGIAYGPLFQGLRWVKVGDQEALAELELASGSESAGAARGLILDCALQATAPLAWSGLDAADSSASPLVPFTIGSVRISRPLPVTCFSYARQRHCGANHAVFDVYVSDGSGEISVTLENVVLRRKRARIEDYLYVPTWIERASAASVHAPSELRRVLVVHHARQADRELALAIAREHERCGSEVHCLLFDDGDDSLDAVGGAIQPDVLYVVDADTGDVPVLQGVSEVAAARTRAEGSVVRLFALANRLLRRGFAERPLELKVVTTGVARVLGRERIRAEASALSGLARSLEREVLRWRVSCIDVAATEPTADVARSIVQEENLSTASEVAFREGRRHERVLSPLRLPPAEAATTARFRQRGVYFIVGGLGGLGFELSKHLARTKNARLFLVGRSPIGPEHQRRLDELAALGAEAAYWAADASTFEQLSRARAEALARFGVIHGVTHSAIVLKDALLANMPESALYEVLAPKVQGTAALFEVFRGDPLDFMLFFSSAESFSCDAGQSNYAAASRFEDAYAAARRDSAGFPVVVVNWGYWGSVGIVASERYRSELSRRGIGSIEPREGMEIVERVVAHADRVGQVAVLKGDIGKLDTLSVDSRQCYVILPQSELAPPLDPPLEISSDQDQLDIDGAFERLEAWSRRRLLAALRRLGAFAARTSCSVAELRAQLGVVPSHTKLFDALLEVLRQEGHLAIGPDGLVTSDRLESAAAEELEAEEAALAKEFPELEPHLRLLAACSDAYPEILTGRVAAREVVFPNGSLALVEGVYRNSSLAWFNRGCAAIVRGEVERRLALANASRLTVLEIGAGTGATSDVVIAALKPLSSRVRYIFSDISASFTQLGATKYAAERSFVECMTWDMEKPDVQGGLFEGSVDVVLGTNVLHATRNIRRSLANVKRLLKPGGVLLLSEATSVQTYITMTFGLLDGWWLFEDAPLRLPGSPLLAPSTWGEVFADAGFEHTRVFGARGVAPSCFKHSLVVGRSDGNVILHVEPDVLASPSVAGVPMHAHSEEASGGRLQPQSAITYVKQVFSEVLGLAPERLNEDATLERFGVDSLVNLKLVRRFESDLGKLPSTLLFEHMTIRKLAEHFSEAYAEALRPTTVGPSTTVPERSSIVPAAHEGIEDDVAIIGCSGRYPLANNLDEFWNNLKTGRNCITPVPVDRWNVGSTTFYARHGGFLEGIDQFDPHFFNMLPDDAGALDPQARLFLETVSQVLEDAGCTSRRIDAVGRRVGVFVGAMSNDYELFCGELHGAGSFTRAHSSHWTIANRVSYHFDLRGPSLAVDTACSSSLTALHLAVESVRRGECSLAIAGGVNLILHPLHLERLCSVNMISRGDACKAFGDGADGFVDGEGVGAVLLKPLARALQDGDHVYGVIKATAVNAGGKTGGFTVPNPNAQAELVSTALRKAQVSARSISYVEAHGTGTELGDPIEVAALTKAFSAETSDRGFCALGSVKSNIGHLESAAGIAGLTKVLLQFRAGQLAPSLHAARLNPRIDFEGSPFYVQQRAEPWPTSLPLGGTKRRASISSFGAGGANAHVILEEYLQSAQVRVPAGGLQRGIFVLSTKHRDLLPVYAERVLAFVRERSTTLGLADLLYTFQVGRDERPERLAIVVASLDELVQKLESFCAGRDDEGVFRGTSRDAPSDAVEPGLDLRRIAEGWVRGAAVRWEGLYALPPRRIPAPTQPFRRQRCWFRGEPRAGSELAPTSGVEVVAASGAERENPENAGSAPEHRALAHVEQTVRGIAAKILKTDAREIDMGVDISEYGMDSINIMFVVSEVREKFGLQLEPRDIVYNRTLAELARYVAARSNGSSTGVSVGG